MKPKIKFYNDGSLHYDGVNSLRFYELFGHLPLNKQQSKELLLDFLSEFDKPQINRALPFTCN